MRGEKKQQATMLALISPEQRVPKGHPLRRIKQLADEALKKLSPTFDAMYAKGGRRSVPPETLLKATLLMALYSVPSERAFCEQLDYNLLWRWFLDMSIVEESFDHSTFSVNRERLMEHDVAAQFLGAVVRHYQLMSKEHFTVDGTLIEAWASVKSFKRKDKPKDPPPPDDPGNPTVDFRGEPRRNDTHESTTDPEARLARKGNGKEAKLCFAQHALMEHRNGLIVDLLVTQASGKAEREAALQMLDEHLPGMQRLTLAGDRGYHTTDFVAALRERNVTPHVANVEHHKPAIDGRTTRHIGYGISQRIRKRVEEIFGWTKTVGLFRKTCFKGVERTDFASRLVGVAYNLRRMANLLPQLA
ncbi:MAG TPA: IS5 family transposase [Myxococcales bacterium]|nr:IS5 family transposase [Myxococcales bacterium]